MSSYQPMPLPVPGPKQQKTEEPDGFDRLFSFAWKRPVLSLVLCILASATTLTAVAISFRNGFDNLAKTIAALLVIVVLPAVISCISIAVKLLAFAYAAVVQMYAQQQLSLLLIPVFCVMVLWVAERCLSTEHNSVIRAASAAFSWPSFLAKE